MTSELRPAVFEVIEQIAYAYTEDVDVAYSIAKNILPVIEADREAVRAEQAVEIERLKAQRDAAILQAQGWKAEAEAHKSTVHEAYQACTGANGEPGNWNGAQPVVNTLAEQAAELAKWKALAEMLAGALEACLAHRYGDWCDIARHALTSYKEQRDD